MNAMQFEWRFVSHALNRVQNYYMTKLKIILLPSCNWGCSVVGTSTTGLETIFLCFRVGVFAVIIIVARHRLCRAFSMLGRAGISLFKIILGTTYIVSYFFKVVFVTA